MVLSNPHFLTNWWLKDHFKISLRKVIAPVLMHPLVPAWKLSFNTPNGLSHSCIYDIAGIQVQQCLKNPILNWWMLHVLYHWVPFPRTIELRPFRLGSVWNSFIQLCCVLSESCSIHFLLVSFTCRIGSTVISSQWGMYIFLTSLALLSLSVKV